MYEPAPPNTSRAVTVVRGFGCSARHCFEPGCESIRLRAAEPSRRSGR